MQSILLSPNDDTFPSNPLHPNNTYSSLSSSSTFATRNHIQTLLENKIDEIDIFEAISDIKDPEHPYSLEELKIVNENSVSIHTHSNFEIIKITFTPTVKHCSLVSHISLCIRERLKRRFGKLRNYKIEIYLTEGSHNEEEKLNKQMNDKERVTAALENPLIMELINQCVGME
ncbi:hypothetical protein ABK040_010405 [Willaertia magna]